MQVNNIARMTSGKKMLTSLALAGGASLLVIGVGALNGGKALAASSFSVLNTTFAQMLSSDWVMVIALVCIIALIWELMHGKGWSRTSVVLGVISMALIGPSFMGTVATATRAPAPLAFVDGQAPQTTVASAETLTTSVR